MNAEFCGQLLAKPLTTRNLVKGSEKNLRVWLMKGIDSKI